MNCIGFYRYIIRTTLHFETIPALTEAICIVSERSVINFVDEVQPNLRGWRHLNTTFKVVKSPYTLDDFDHFSREKFRYCSTHCSITFMFSRDIYVAEFCLKSTSKQTSGKGTDNAHNTMLKIAKLHQNYWIQDKNDRRLNWGPSITIMVEKLVTTMLGAYLHCRNPNRFYFSCSYMTPDPRIILLYLHVHVTVGLVQK
jgi:hypothetical protein